MKQQRNSRQRQLVLATVKEHTDHPTADEIYLEARMSDDKISRGTVYRNLNLLAQTGKSARSGCLMRTGTTAAWIYTITCCAPAAARFAMRPFLTIRSLIVNWPKKPVMQSGCTVLSLKACAPRAKRKRLRRGKSRPHGKLIFKKESDFRTLPGIGFFYALCQKTEAFPVPNGSTAFQRRPPPEVAH